MSAAMEVALCGRRGRTFAALVAIALIGAVLAPSAVMADAVPPLSGYQRYDAPPPTGSVFQFAGTWTPVPSAPNAFSATVANGTASTSIVKFKFRGTGFSYVCRMGTARGWAKITVDPLGGPDSSVVEVDLQDPLGVPTHDQQVPYSKTGMQDTVHEVWIQTAWATPPSSGSSKQISLDAIDLPQPSTGARLLGWSTTYNIAASVNGSGGSISPAGTTAVADGADQTYTITADPGYRIKDVVANSVSQGAVGTYTFENVSAGGTIVATFERVYNIVASVTGNGSVTPAGTTVVVQGGSQTYTITPDLGYRIDHFDVDGVDAGRGTSYTFTNVTGPHTIAATFVWGTVSTPASSPVTIVVMCLAGIALGAVGLRYGTKRSGS